MDHSTFMAAMLLVTLVVGLTGCGTEAPLASTETPSTPTATDTMGESPTSMETGADPSESNAADPGLSDPALACLGAASDPSWRTTLELLDRVEALLPTFSARPAPKRCMTDAWASVDPMRADVERALARDYEEGERRRRAQWLAALPRETVWLRVFVPGASHAWIGGSNVTYQREPQLSRDIRFANLTSSLGGTHHCAVLAASIQGGDSVIYCGTPGASRDQARFIVTMRRTALRAPIALGDVVSFSGHLTLVGEFERNGEQVVRWRFDEVPSFGVSVVARGTCCPR